jgi:hypothetical protein
MREVEDQIRNKQRDLQRAFERLANGVANDFENGRRQAMQAVGGAAQEWAQLMKSHGKRYEM